MSRDNRYLQGVIHHGMGNLRNDELSRAACDIAIAATPVQVSYCAAFKRLFLRGGEIVDPDNGR